MGMNKEVFGKTSKGETVYVVTVENGNGVTMKLLNYGATLAALSVPDKKGAMADVVLGFDDMEGYEKQTSYQGATVGRNGNRIEASRFSINGVEYFMEKNEGENVCHSGPNCYNRRIWGMELLEETNSVRFSLHSPHMDQGFPGNFDVTVTYTLTEENEVKIHYEGKSDMDTMVNMTNHSYFNLNGHDGGKTVENHLVQINAEYFTPVRPDLIPTGELRAVKETPFDFRTMKELGRDMNVEDEQLSYGQGYDHNFVLDDYNGAVRKVVEVWEKESGRCMEIFTDCPAIQMYAGNVLAGGPNGKNDTVYGKHGGLALETQFCPDAIHHENFVSPILKAGELYDSITIYKFSIKE